MNKNVRILFIVASLVLIVAVGASTASAAASPFYGAWESTDMADGSYQLLHIGGGPGNSHRIRYYDFGATVCGVDPESGQILYGGWAKGFVAGSGNTLSGTLPFYCHTTPPALWGNVTFQFTYDPATDSITDGWGNVWTRK